MPGPRQLDELTPALVGLAPVEGIVDSNEDPPKHVAASTLQCFSLGSLCLEVVGQGHGGEEKSLGRHGFAGRDDFGEFGVDAVREMFELCFGRGAHETVLLAAYRQLHRSAIHRTQVTTRASCPVYSALPAVGCVRYSPIRDRRNSAVDAAADVRFAEHA